MNSIPQRDQSATQSPPTETSISTASSNTHETGVTSNHPGWMTGISDEMEEIWRPAAEDYATEPATLDLFSLKALYRAGLRAHRRGEVPDETLLPFRLELEKRGQAQRALDRQSERRQWIIALTILAVGFLVIMWLAINDPNNHLF